MPFRAFVVAFLFFVTLSLLCHCPIIFTFLSFSFLRRCVLPLSYCSSSVFLTSMFFQSRSPFVVVATRSSELQVPAFPC